jgi:uncharacterized repeat protein (TIGR01451 family)
VFPNFELDRILTVDGTGSGNGITTGTAPSTIACSSSAAVDSGICAEIVADGTVVVLTATSAGGSTFTGWSGCDSAVSNVCTQTVSGGNETVSPNFELNRTLTVDGTGSGNGSTLGTPPSSINCDSTAGVDTVTCSETVSDGTIVVLTATATAIAGSTFTGWTGCDSAVSNVCKQTVSGANETVSPNFEAPDFTATKSNDTSGGTVDLGDTFTWTITVTNISSVGTTFFATPSPKATVLQDQLPSNATYGSPSYSFSGGATEQGVLSCGINGSNVLSCTIQGSVIFPSGGSLSVSFDVTPTAAGTLTNSSNICVDPDNKLAETNELNNDCDDEVVVEVSGPEPDFTATKSNDTSGGTVELGDTFTWTITVTNIGSVGAAFFGSTSPTVLQDQLPSNATYGSPTYSFSGGAHEAGFLICGIDGSNVLLCFAGGSVIFPSGGSVSVSFDVTPTAAGTLTNAANICVDPDNKLAETNELNNDCDDVVEVLPLGSPLGPPLGDPNRDGSVDIIDARICLQIATGAIAGTQDEIDACDLDGDGSVSVDEAEQIAEFAIGLTNTLAAAGMLAGLALLLGMPFFMLFRRKRRSLLSFSLLIACLGLVMTGCSLFPAGTTALYAIVSDQFITISVQNMPGGGLAAFSTTNGGFTFDPNILSVNSIQAIGGFELLASQIDNANGEVKWGIVNPGGGVVNGVVLIMNTSVKTQNFTPDQAKVQWRRGRLTLSDDTNTEIKPAQYKVFPVN